MKLDIWIEVRDRNLIEDLFEVEGSQYNKIIIEKPKKIIGEGISMQYKSHYSCDAENIPTWLIITLEFVALPIAVNIISSYIYDKLKNRKNERLMINNQTVEINAKKIEQLIIININTNVKEKEDKEKKQKP